VVLVDFWTYTCINCIRTLPTLNAWDRRYRAKGLTIIGVHTPEFPFEKRASNVEAAIRQNGLRYPVVQDNDFETWDAYRNRYWPAEYLIDTRGNIRYVHFGEGDYEVTERAIRSVLAEAGAKGLGREGGPAAERRSPGTTTPESYLGSARAERFENGRLVPGARTFPAEGRKPRPDHLAYRGRWRLFPRGATALSGAELDLNFKAQRVFLVLGSPKRARNVRILLDGRPLPDGLAGEDVRSGVARIGPQRLYRLVELPRAERHVLTLRFQRGVSGYAFTFG
jgi:thiol-disulfide isomerase/thioredoxin